MTPQTPLHDNNTISKLYLYKIYNQTKDTIYYLLKTSK